MAATIEWQVSDASVAIFTDLTGGAVLRFKNANNNVNDLNNPLVRPTSGTNYSFEKALRINVQAAGGAVELSSLRVKLSVASPGASGPGGVEQAYNFQSAYTQPQQYSGGTGGIGGAMPGREGTLNTSETTWTSAVNHNLSADGAGNTIVWNSSENLYCQLEVAPGSGGTISWQTIAVYNEV